VKVYRTETLKDEAYSEIISLLHSGGVIAFPTDTAYGLGADPFNDAAVDRIFQVKGRADTKAILLIVSSIEMAESVAEPPKVFYDLAKQFWPGPLTVILPAKKSLPINLTAGTATVGVRWPIADFATKLVNDLGTPVTATSANRSGLPAAITADEVRNQLDESVDALVDGGELPSRGGSTVLALTADVPVVLREGPVRFEALERFFGGKVRRLA
jgi:L-threonylcarbamoyladenylate synthase